MTRYFYTDPLAAAWMARHFGMKLVCLHHNKDDGVEAEQAGTPYPFAHAILSAEMWEDAIHATCRRIYVHAESLRLLEPQVGDMISHLTSGGERASYTIVPQDSPLKEKCPHSFGPPSRADWDLKHASGVWEHKIIQRNGVAFHHPESEAT